jgi:CRISPR system Cascade subunit CasD
MSSDTAFLALMLDAPMQSWGFSSRFQRRTTGLHPTKSGVIGMICAAMGLAKGSDAERQALKELSHLGMTTVVIARQRRNRWSEEATDLPVLRMEDYHTVQGTRKASDATGAKADPEATVLTHRQYLLDAKFGVILAGERPLLEKVAEKLQDPVWGVWFGRKNCIPAEPVYRGVFSIEEEALKKLVGDTPKEALTRIKESSFNTGNDTWNDAPPASYGDMRPWPVRRISQSVAEK